MTQPPVPKSADFDRLIRLMLMTTSQHDGEALNAMRAANNWLRKGGLDWEAVLKGKVTIVADPFAGLDEPPQVARADYGMQTARYASAPPPRPRPTPPPRPQAPSQPMGPQPSSSFRTAFQQARSAPPPPRQTRQKRTTLADLGLD